MILFGRILFRVAATSGVASRGVCGGSCGGGGALLLLYYYSVNNKQPKRGKRCPESR